MQKKMTNIAVPVVDSGAVHAARHVGHTLQQRPLKGKRWRPLGPIHAIVFKTDGRRQLFGDDERMLSRWIATALGKRNGRHGGNASLLQTLNSDIFVARTQHRQSGAEQILDDFAPADSPDRKSVV